MNSTLFQFILSNSILEHLHRVEFQTSSIGQFNQQSSHNTIDPSVTVQLCCCWRLLKSVDQALATLVQWI